MSGGSDSAVAARGPGTPVRRHRVHLALALIPDLPDRGGAAARSKTRFLPRGRRDRHQPFYVWTGRAVPRGTWSTTSVNEYAAGRTPNPCLRCNGECKSTAADRSRSPLDAVHRPPATRRAERPLRAHRLTPIFVAAQAGVGGTAGRVLVDKSVGPPSSWNCRPCPTRRTGCDHVGRAACGAGVFERAAATGPSGKVWGGITRQRQCTR